ncbi:hypothetical protein MHH42_30985 [Bacillus sp. FSL L8-0099]|uniref:hypothetical protein n=1 Tax=unclassified Bacillus (in: firmicutes) TaxID=185979 RepID=UPI0030FC8070
MKSDIKLIQEDSLRVVAEFREGYINFIKEDNGKTSIVTMSYDDLEHALKGIKEGKEGTDEARKGLEMEFFKDGVTIHRPTEYVTLFRREVEIVYNEIRKSEGLQEEDNKQDELEITKLQAQKEILQEQIQMMHAKERELEEKIVKHQQSIERRKYKGKTFHEYLESVAGHYEEDGFNIQVGSAWDRTIYVSGMNGDFDVNIDSSYDDKRGYSLKVSKDTGVRSYFKEYFEGEIPKNHQKIYDEMVAIKNKYGKMIIDGVLEPKEA